MLAEPLRGARSDRRSAGYFTGSLLEITHEWLEPISVVRIVCNVDLSPKDSTIAQLREARTLGRWNEYSIDATLAFAGPANYCPVLVGSIGGARWGASAIQVEHLARCRDRPRLEAAAAALAAKEWSPAHV